jgi:hypothetical protein
MTAPDRGATYQIALASTGSSTHNAWYPRRESARGGNRPFRSWLPRGGCVKRRSTNCARRTQETTAPASADAVGCHQANGLFRQAPPAQGCFWKRPANQDEHSRRGSERQHKSANTRADRPAGRFGQSTARANNLRRDGVVPSTGYVEPLAGDVIGRPGRKT